jgi:hypothetical protein
MLRTCTLIRPVVAFSPDTKQVLTIPAGTVIDLPGSLIPVGIESISWGGREVMVSREDVGG